MTSTHSSPIPFPTVLAENQEKLKAFEAGWLHAHGELPHHEVIMWEQRFGGLKLNSDVRSHNLVQNAFWWGYYTALNVKPEVEKARKKQSKADKKEAAEDIELANECNIGESHQLTLVDIYDRMHRNPGFIPAWAWGRDDEFYM